MIINVFCVFLFLCLSTCGACDREFDTYHTYEIEGVKADYFTHNPDNFCGWIKNGRKNCEYRLNDGIVDYFRFILNEKSEERIDTVRSIYSEPYDLLLYFETGNTDRIIFNEMFFQSKNKGIDLRGKVEVRLYGKKLGELSEDESSYWKYIFEEEELADFRVTGIIDINKYRDESIEIQGIRIKYVQIDVDFKKDRYFSVKYDLTFEGDYGQKNYYFAPKFIRKSTTEKLPWWSV
jgi:hypothetical protein